MIIDAGANLAQGVLIVALSRCETQDPAHFSSEVPHV